MLLLVAACGPSAVLTEDQRLWCAIHGRGVTTVMFLRSIAALLILAVGLALR